MTKAGSIQLDKQYTCTADLSLVRIVFLALLLGGSLLSFAQSGTTCDCWIAPDGTYTTIDNNADWDAAFGFSNADDGSHGPVALPFNFDLYGTTWNQAWVNTNGNLTVDNFMTGFTAAGFPVMPDRIIAPFWADVDLRGPGAANNIVQYKVTPTAMYVNWTNVGYYNSHTDKVNTFQLIITDGTDPVVANGANVSFCYKDMQWTTGDANSGILGFLGTPANVGANQGNGVDFLQFGRFDQPGNIYDGPFGNNDGIDFLDDQYFSFATDVSSANVPPVIVGQSICDTLTVCAGLSSQLDVTFLSPEPTQITTATSFAPSLSNYTIVSNTPGLNADISTSFTPTAADTGYHVITFQATDNGTPVQTTTLTIIVHVLPAQGTAVGTLDACISDPPTDLFTTLVPAAAPGGNWTDPAGGAHSGIFDPAVDAPGMYHYDLSTGGCQNIANVTVSVAQPLSAGGDNSASYCSNNAVADLFPLLLGAPQAGGSWYDTNGAPYNGMFDPNGHPSGDYEYVVFDPGACPNDTAVISVTVSPAVFSGGDSVIFVCEDEPLFSMRSQLQGTPDLGGTWVDPSGIIVNDTLIPNAGPQGIYQYILTTTAPCLNDTAFLEVVIHPLPNAGTDNQLTICADAPAQLLFPTLGAGVDATGTWLGPDLNTHTDTLVPANDVSGTYSYIVLGAGQCTGRVDSAFVDATIHLLPEPQFTLGPNAGCAPLNVTLENITDTLVGTDCVWLFGNGDLLNDCGGQVNFLYQDPGLYTVSLTITSPAGCVAQLSLADAVLVQPAPQATFTVNPDPVTDLNPTVHFQNTDPYSVQHAWTFDGADTAITASTIYTFPDQLSDDYEVCLAVMDVYGCVDTNCRMVQVFVPELYVPNAFTPDGDGNNEVFVPVLVDMITEDYEMQIFDRWGQEVFATKDILQGWDGSLGGGGTKLAEGVYVWRISARGKETVDKKEYLGHVTLLK